MSGVAFLILKYIQLYAVRSTGYRKLWHSGGIVSFTSQLWLFPDMDSGVFVSCNGPYAVTSKVVQVTKRY